VANIVTSIGSFGAFITNPSLPPGMTIRGLVGDGVFIDAAQANDNARRVLLTSGSTKLLTNTFRNGILTLRVSRVSHDLFGIANFNTPSITGISIQGIGNTIGFASGDLVVFCGYLQSLGAPAGSMIACYYDLNGQTEIITFLECGLIKCDPFKLSASEVQVYDVSFAYKDFIRS
jgi:hypothetical protein